MTLVGIIFTVYIIIQFLFDINISMCIICFKFLKIILRATHYLVPN